ncbi:MAG TPA: response regulator, partial [Stenomitos sp.]
TLINLLGNAIKFTQTGRVTLRVGWKEKGNPTRIVPRPQFSTAKTRLWFEVEDTGPGIAPEELSSLFDPFVQSATGRQSMEGTGLGLPISQQFVRLMGGEITVTSTPGQGAIFRFDIQIGLATTADEKPVSGKRRIIGLEPNQPSYRLLIVEDAAVNRKLLVKILEPLGFEVRTALNGQEGVTLWESWSPHLIWMDVIMPIMDGYEATRYIKQTPKGQKTVIIALTANAFEEQQEAILKAGCDDFVAKPFQREVLLEKIAHHLGVRYLYEQQGTPRLGESQAPLQPMAPKALSIMPTSWVTQLHQAALYADDELMKQLIEQIPSEYDSLRRSLKALVDNFLLEQIINLTEPARP